MRRFTSEARINAAIFLSCTLSLAYILVALLLTRSLYELRTKSVRRTCRPIIDLLLYEGKDAFLWLPTSFGKSICYEVLPFVFDVKLCPVGSLVVVVLLFLSLTNL